MSLHDLLQRIDINTYIGDVSEREDLTWELIQKYSSLSWSVDSLSRLAPLDYIIEHPEQTWNYYEISARKDLTIDFIKEFQDLLDFEIISENINIEDVINNPELPWDYIALSINSKVTSDDLINHSELPWDYQVLSAHIDVNFVYANPQCDWYYPSLYDRIKLDLILPSGNKYINDDHIKYCYLSENPNLTIDYILEHLDKPWQWEKIYSNPNISLEDIIKRNLHNQYFNAFQQVYPDYCVENLKKLSWRIITQYVSLDIFDKYPKKPWDYAELSKNKNLTMDYVLAHPDIKWNYEQLSCDNQITLSDVLDHWDLPWDIHGVLEYKY